MNARIHWARTSALAAVLLLATCQMPLRNAQGQSSVHIKTVRTTIERQHGIDPQPPIPPGWQPIRGPGNPLPEAVVPTKIQVFNDHGGIIGEHEARWQYVRNEGKEVEVLGMCQSACTLVLANIPKTRLCFGPKAYFNFHSARYSSNNRPAPPSNQYMFDRYPPEIQGWLVAKGGWEKLPLDGYWTLPAAELFQMGYRRCPQALQ